MPITSHVPQKMSDKPIYSDLPLSYTDVLTHQLHSFAGRPLEPLSQNITISAPVDSSGVRDYVLDIKLSKIRVCRLERGWSWCLWNATVARLRPTCSPGGNVAILPIFAWWQFEHSFRDECCRWGHITEQGACGPFLRGWQINYKFDMEPSKPSHFALWCPWSKKNYSCHWLRYVTLIGSDLVLGLKKWLVLPGIVIQRSSPCQSVSSSRSTTFMGSLYSLFLSWTLYTPAT